MTIQAVHVLPSHPQAQACELMLPEYKRALFTALDCLMAEYDAAHALVDTRRQAEIAEDIRSVSSLLDRTARRR